MYRPQVVVILEPRISAREADLACHRIGYPDWVRSEAKVSKVGLGSSEMDVRYLLRSFT